MIFLDLSQIMISTIVMDNHEVKTGDGTGRHIFFSKVLSLKRMFHDYGEIFLFADSDEGYWRKDVFPYYKGDRARKKAASKIDWDSVMQTVYEVKKEVKELNIYPFIEVPKCEADDGIAVACKWAQENRILKTGLVEEPEPIVICSADGDFVQLQKYRNVRQWNPMAKKWVRPEGSLRDYTRTHIVKAGDDAIPNILSPDNSIVDQIRQKAVRQPFLDSILAMDDPEQEIEDPEILARYKRNRALIDLSLIPQEYEDRIVYCLENQTAKMNRMKLFQYFVKHHMKLLNPHLQEF